MDQEGGDPCEVKKASSEPKTPTVDHPDSISPSDSDPSLSEEELLLTDEEIIESIYDSLFQIILVVQLQQGSAETWCSDDCPTPRSRTTKMVPDTCPGAPMQLSKIWRNNGSASGSGRPRRILF